MSRRPTSDRALVADLLAAGHSSVAISERSQVPVSTVRRWKRELGPLEPTWRPGHEPSYAYLLGLYLGDGCISRSRRGGVLLRVTLDAIYPSVIDACHTAMQLSMPDNRVGVAERRHARVVDVQSSGKRWLLAFPQHGPGRKHLRPIRLSS